MPDNYDFVIKLRAIRDYKPEPISEQDLNAILEAARWTGSSKNRQNWSFIVVKGQEDLNALAAHGDYTTPVRSSAATIVLVKEVDGNMFDIGRAAQNIMLAADAVGVATCPITLHREKDARAHLGAPEGTSTRYAVAMGYPAEGAEPRRNMGRKPNQDVVRYDRY